MNFKKFVHIFKKANYFVLLSLAIGLFFWGVFAAAFVPNKILNAGGSTSVSPIFTHDLEKEFLKEEGQKEIEYFSVGSSGGLRNVIYGQYDVGFMSKAFSIDDANYQDYKIILNNNGNTLKIFQLAKDGIIFIYTLPDGCSISQSSDDKLNLQTNTLFEKVYKKKDAYWDDLSQVNCNERGKKIIRYNREPGSGTRSVFEKKILQKTNAEKKYFSDQIESKSGHLLQRIRKTKGALAYISFAYKDKLNEQGYENVQYAKLDAIDPTETTISDNSYKFFRPFVGLYLQKNQEKLTSFLNFLQKSKAKELIKEAGFVFEYKENYFPAQNDN